MSNYSQLYKTYDELIKAIEDLPKGYLSYKTIYGKKRVYLQWQENKKKVSKYIPNNEVKEIQEKIKKRKELVSCLKKIDIKSTVNAQISKNYQFKTNIRLGSGLLKFVNEVKKYKKRDCFNDINKYLYSENNNKVLIIYGLRRTGKTTLIRQAIREMDIEEIQKTAFIQITPKDNLASINSDLKYLESKEYKYIFIDEVTLISDFVEGAALFSDLFAASGMKIILTGTDSLGFMFSLDNQLYDRCIMIHTTFIPYKEFENVLGIKGIDNYISYGGTMSISGTDYNKNSTFANSKSTNEYIDSAIARNIQHSLKCYQSEGHFRHLGELYKNNELTNVINRIVEDINHRFTLEILTRDFLSNDLAISRNNLRKDKHNANDILDKIDIKQFTNKLKELLEIKNKEDLKTKIKDIHKEEIKEYLKLLDLIDDIDISTIPQDSERLYRTVFTQPGIRYSQAKALVEVLLTDSKFQSISKKDKDYILERILSEIKGRMLEDIILLETKKYKQDYKVFKLQFAIGEFDMVVMDEHNYTCQLYEIKYSKEIIEEQYKNLIDKNKCKEVENKFGKIISKSIIYRGINKIINSDINYINVEDYLNNLYK